MIVDVQEFAEKSWRNISPPAKCSFLSALVFGMITHIVFWTGFLFNHDSVLFFYEKYSWLLMQGKWLFDTAIGLNGRMSSAAINTIIAILFLSFVAGFTTAILQIRQKIMAVLVGVLLVTFPAVLSTIVYNTSDVFFMSLLLATMSVYFAVSPGILRWGGVIISILMLVASLGIYQGYIGYAAGLYVIVSLIHAINNKTSTKELICNGMKYVLVLLVSITLYYIILHIALDATSMSLSNYQNADKMGRLGLHGYLNAIIATYDKVTAFFVNDNYGVGDVCFIFVYRLVVLLIVMLIGFTLFQNRVKKPSSLLLTVLIVALFPLAIHLVMVLSGVDETHWIMMYSIVLGFILLVKLMDNCKELDEKHMAKHAHSIKLALNWMGVILSFFIAYQWYLITNESYTRLQLNYEHTYARMSMLAHDIYSHEEYSDNVEVIVFGAGNEFFHPATLDPNMDRTLVFTGIIRQMNSNVAGILTNLIGMKNVNRWPPEDIKKTEEYLEMAYYPDENSIKLIDDRLVVKMTGD